MAAVHIFAKMQIKQNMQIVFGVVTGIGCEWYERMVHVQKEDFSPTVIEESPLSSRKQEHWSNDIRGAVPYGNGSDEQKRGGGANGGIASPLDEDEEGLTVDRSNNREGDQSG